MRRNLYRIYVCIFWSRLIIISKSICKVSVVNRSSVLPWMIYDLMTSCWLTHKQFLFLLYLMNVNKDILAFFWLRFVMWFYFIFHGMTTILQRSHYVSRDFTLSDWPVDIDRLKKLKWWPINPGSIETWNSIQLLHFIEYIQQYFSYVVAISYVGGGSRRTRRKPPTCRK